jgi:hypothetical protein
MPQDYEEYNTYFFVFLPTSPVFSLPLSLDKKYIAVAICGDGTEG